MTTPSYRLRDGQPTDYATWSRLNADPTYVQIAGTLLADTYWTSTIWIGAATSTSNDAAALFETVVFDIESMQGVDRARYATEAEARRGHDEMVSKWS